MSDVNNGQIVAKAGNAIASTAFLLTGSCSVDETVISWTEYENLNRE